MAFYLAQIRRLAMPPHPFSPAPDRSQTSAQKDGTATADSTPSTTPAGRQTAQSLHTYTSSKSAETGNSRRTKPTDTPYKYAAPPAPLSHQWIASPSLDVGQTSVCLLLSCHF